jgi:hypothetical protein
MGCRLQPSQEGVDDGGFILVVVLKPQNGKKPSLTQRTRCSPGSAGSCPLLCEMLSPFPRNRLRHPNLDSDRRQILREIGEAGEVRTDRAISIGIHNDSPQLFADRSRKQAIRCLHLASTHAHKYLHAQEIRTGSGTPLMDDHPQRQCQWSRRS